MSAHGMSEAGGLREAVEALADQFMAQGCHHRHQQGETDECNACTASDFAALLAAHPAPEADPTAGAASTSASEPLSEDVEALARVHVLGRSYPLGEEAAHAIIASDWLAAREAKARAEAGEQIAQAIEAGVQSSHPNEGYKDGFRRAAQIAREVTS